METATIRACTVADIEAANSLAELEAEYRAEASVPGMPGAEICFDVYQAMEQAGMLKVAGAWLGDKLIGFVAATVTTMPNYGAVAGAVNVFFVASAYRSTGAGLRLLKQIEADAKQAGAQAMLVGAPIGGPLAEVLPRVGYDETNRTFLKVLA